MFGKICISTGYMIIVPGKSRGRYPLNWMIGETLSRSVHLYKEEICWHCRNSNPGSSSPYHSLWYFIWKSNVRGNVCRRINLGIILLLLLLLLLFYTGINFSLGGSSPYTRISRYCEKLPMKTELFLPLDESTTCPVYNLGVCYNAELVSVSL